MSQDYLDGDYIYDTHYRALKRAVAGNAIVSGYAMTPVSGMTIDMALGVHWAAGVRRTCTPGNIVVPAADPTYARWDLICSKATTPYWQYITGTMPSTVIPVPPELPDGEIILGMVWVPPGVSIITAIMLREMGFISPLLEHSSRHAAGGLDQFLHAAQHAFGQPDVITPASIQAEPQFSKLTAFNKNYETTPANIKMDGVQGVGVLDTLPRADHVHPTDTSRASIDHDATHLVGGTDALSVGSPVNIAASGSDGTATNFARRDHVHGHPSGLGENLHHNRSHTYDSGSDHTGTLAPAKITPGTEGQVLRVNSTPVPAWVTLEIIEIGIKATGDGMNIPNYVHSLFPWLKPPSQNVIRWASQPAETGPSGYNSQNGMKLTSNNEYLAYINDSSHNWYVYVLRDGVIANRLDFAHASYDINAIDITQDGKFIAIGLQGSPYIEVYEFDGKTISAPLTLPSIAMDYGAVAWSPNGKYIALGKGQIWERNGTAFTKINCNNYPSSPVCGAEWSPDGKFLALQQQSGGNWTHIYELQNGAFIRVYMQSQTTYGRLRWSPQGDLLLKTDPDNSFASIIKRTTNNDGTTSFTSPVNLGWGTYCRDIAWSPNGEYVFVLYASAVTSGQYARMYRRRADGASPYLEPLTDIHPSMTTGGYNCAWSSDGSTIFVSLATGGRYLEGYRTLGQIPTSGLVRTIQPMR